MEKAFVNGFNEKGETLKSILLEQVFELLSSCVKELRIQVEDWAKISFNFLRYFKH